MAKNRDESDETQSEYYDSESKRSRRQKGLRKHVLKILFSFVGETCYFGRFFL